MQHSRQETLLRIGFKNDYKIAIRYSYGAVIPGHEGPQRLSIEARLLLLDCIEIVSITASRTKSPERKCSKDIFSFCHGACLTHHQPNSGA